MRKKDDTLKENPRLLTNEHDGTALRFAMRRAAEIASELLSGRAEAAPVSRGRPACAIAIIKAFAASIRPARLPRAAKQKALAA
jgi:hypothetical protein